MSGTASPASALPIHGVTLGDDRPGVGHRLLGRIELPVTERLAEGGRGSQAPASASVRAYADRADVRASSKAASAGRAIQVRQMSSNDVPVCSSSRSSSPRQSGRDTDLDGPTVRRLVGGDTLGRGRPHGAQGIVAARSRIARATASAAA